MGFFAKLFQSEADANREVVEEVIAVTIERLMARIAAEKIDLSGLNWTQRSRLFWENCSEAQLVVAGQRGLTHEHVEQIVKAANLGAGAVIDRIMGDQGIPKPKPVPVYERGGAGEPFCSARCRGRAGDSTYRLMFEGWVGAKECVLCHREYRYAGPAAMHAVISSPGGSWTLICRDCAQRGLAARYAAALDKCAWCGNPVS